MDGKYRPHLVTDASNFFDLISKFEFIAALIISNKILDGLLPVTLLLQGKSIDIMDGIHLINSMKNDFTITIGTVLIISMILGMQRC